MRIKRVEIISFGKFKNYALDFSDGFNLMFGKNEDGKSTLMAFISLMLYGTAGSSSRTDISENFRKKYAPWSGDKMSGDMEIECRGRSYLIHKEFRATSKTDKVTVTDTETGNAVNLPPDTEIGKFFLGIDYNAFEKSVFGATADCFAGTESGDIAARLSNLAESGDEAVSTKNVLARIEKAMDELMKKRSKGKINLAQDRIEELNSQIDKVDSQAEQRRKLSEEYTKTEKELSDLNEKVRKMRLALAGEENRRKADACRTLAGLSDMAEQAENKVKALVGTGEPAEILQKCSEYENAVAVARDVLSKTEKVSPQKAVTDEDMRKYFLLSEEKQKAVVAEATAKARKGKYRLSLIIGSIIFLVGVLGGIFNPLIFSASAVGLIISVLSQIKLKNQPNDSDLRSTEKKLAELFESRGCHSAAEFEKAYRESITMIEKAKIYEEAQRSLKLAETVFVEYVGQYRSVSSSEEGKEFVKTLSKLQSDMEKARQSRDSYAYAFKLEELNPQKLLNLAQDIEKGLPTETVNSADVEKAEHEIKMKNNELLEIKGMLGKEPEDIAPLMRERDELLEKANEMEAYYQDLTMARDVLVEAEDEMRRSFAPALKERASEILSILTGGKYQSLSTDKIYEIGVKSEDTGGYRSRHYLSRGTLAQSYLALRIALCEMLSENEPVPLLLDDVFADYDDERAALASEFLENYARNGRQIIFFTCHSWQGRIQTNHNMLG